MLGEYVLVQKLLASVLVGYLLGSVPFARVAARLKGVDIFATGSRTAGTANVFWNIGRRTGILVFAGDVAKGSMAVVIAGLLDISAPLVLLAGAAAVIGHWNSIFTRFRGGDGMATLLGISAALVPNLALVGVAAGFGTVVLLRRYRFRSAWGLMVCIAVMLALSLYYQVHRDLVLGLTALAALVLLHSLLAHRRRSHLPPVPAVELGAPVGPDSDLGQRASERH